MRYLKKYRTNESENKFKDLFSPHINWDLIETIKDLSMEYIDDGYSLVIQVGLEKWRDNVPLYACYSITYNNYYKDYNLNEEGNWFSNSAEIIKDLILDGKIFYECIIEDKLDGVLIKSATDEITDRIRDIYPGEKINEDI